MIGSDYNQESVYDKYDKSSKNMHVFGLNEVPKYLEAFAKDFSEQFGIVEAGAYTTFFLLVVVGYHMCTDGVFSSLVTFASVVQLLGLTLTALKISKQQSFGSVSVTSLQLYVPIYMLRLSCTMFHEGYLPLCRSGDWAYQLADICSLCVVIWLLVKSYKNPTVKQEQYFPSALITLGCVALGCYIYPRHNLGTWPDFTWVSSLYLETFVMLPQLRLLAQEMNVESLTSHSIACTAAYRTMNFYFWIICRKELVRARNPTWIPAYFVVGALGIQTVLLFDFVFYYMKALVNRTGMTLPWCDV